MHHLLSEALGWVIIIVVGYAVLHVVLGALLHPIHRARGRRVNFGWSLSRGPWYGVRAFGGTYYHHL